MLNGQRFRRRDSDPNLATLDDALTCLRKASGDPSARFLDAEWAGIDRLVNDRGQVLVVQATGWSASMVNLAAASLLQSRGHAPTVLVSPSVPSLQQHSIAARRLDLPVARFMRDDVDTWDAGIASIDSGAVALVLIDATCLASENLRHKLLDVLRQRTGLLIVDEAHIASEPGREGRPDHVGIRFLFKSVASGIPILATTTSGDERAIEDLVLQLGSGIEMLRGPFREDSHEATPSEDNDARGAVGDAIDSRDEALEDATQPSSRGAQSSTGEWHDRDVRIGHDPQR